MSDLVSLHLCQYLVQSFILVVLIVVWIWISLRLSDAENLVFCLFAICVSSSVKCLFMPFLPFLTGFFVVVFFTIEFWESSMYAWYDSSVRCVVCKYFLLSCSSSFYPLNRVFHRVWSFQFLWSPMYLFFNFMECIFGVIAQYSLMNSRNWRFSPVIF